ncbi:ergothioneine biosynthesis protein EgtB [Williamsia sterculiae]|uniref:Hercynine oxygenase n=1 Tax=Williamsia sterculiae TaxID=1344003 RepID=A0A1N7FLL8_9NOCA|nr:ergothioneine biosynthesis protein EgtB [Williamsia sterculiae]SIS01167.1 iron(II)-dependent oxidoreductase [Williamsia sterculiae]
MSITDDRAGRQAADDVEHLRDRVARTLQRARTRTELLTDSVDDADLVAQHSSIMSPLVWDLAHIGNQEELWLVRDVGGRESVRADIDEMYDAFKTPRKNRPALPLLDPTQARAYVRSVRDEALDVLSNTRFAGNRLVEGGFAFGMVAQHEQQHDETMLATHQLRVGAPVLHAPPTPRPATSLRPGAETVVAAGTFEMGTSVDPWALDNERPAHTVDVPAFAIDTFPVTNGQYLDFIADGGYDRRELWSERGWQHRVEAGLTAPQFWYSDGDGWGHDVFGQRGPVDPDRPVVHVSWFEADACARWLGKRLPTEAEWEKAARWDPTSGSSRTYPWGDEHPEAGVHDRRANLGQTHLEPAAIGAYPDGASATGVQQMIGDVWEWTSSDFHSYPGFRFFPYAEYSEVFHGGDYKVLRGGSFGTDPVAVRGTFRNWDHPIRRQIFAGFRCARDVVAG